MILSENERRAGRTIVAGFDSTSLPADISNLLKHDALSGIILFKRNVETVAQAASLNEEARRAAPADRPPITSVDQEGGRVVRLRNPLTALPPARKFGEIDDSDLTRAAGLLVGEELSAAGFNLNFAPVLDVDTNPASPVIGDRAYGSSPESVIRHAFAFAEGLRTGGVSPCAKHFPGHGDAALDSHLALPSVSCDASRLDAVELVPFEAWARATSDPIMTAHVKYPALDPKTPATLSEPILTGLLRNRLGFSGPVFSDDLEMGALKEFGGPGGAAVRAISAGADGLLICRRIENVHAAIEALAREADRDSAFAARLDAAGERLCSLRRMPACDFSYLNSPLHRERLRAIEPALSRSI